MQRILLIEANEDLREMATELLGGAGFAVDAVGSVPAAEELLDGVVYDLVMADLFAPVRAKAIRLISGFARQVYPTPIAWLTTVDVPESKAGAHGLAFVLQKPFTADALIAVAAAMVSRSLPASDPRVVLVERYFRALETRDRAALGALVTDDVVHVPPSPGVGPVHGRVAFVRHFDESFRGIEDVHFEQIAVWALPEGVVARYASRWKGATGPGKIGGAVSFVFDGEKIARVGVQLDPQRFARVWETSRGSP